MAWCGVGSVLRRRVQGLWVQYEDGDVLRRYQEEMMPEWSLAVGIRGDGPRYLCQRVTENLVWEASPDSECSLGLWSLPTLS